jgi:protein SCO1
MTGTVRAIVLGLWIAFVGGAASAQMFPPQYRDIGIEQRPGAALPLDATFRDENGVVVQLGDYFHEKPVLLMPVYYTCSTLCPEALRGLVEGISRVPLQPGRDFEIVAFSFNPEETPTDALEKLKECRRNYAGTRESPGWHFLTGSAASIARVTRAIGFHYRYDPQQHMFIHASGMMIATPDGHIAQYLFGVSYQPSDLQQGIRIASQNRVEAPTQASRLLCYPFATAAGRYNKAALLALRSGAVLMLAALAVYLFALWRFDMRRHRGEGEVVPRSLS